jgi:isoamylase
VSVVHRLGAHFDQASRRWTVTIWSSRATSVRLVIAHRRDPSHAVLDRELAPLEPTNGSDAAPDDTVRGGTVLDGTVWGCTMDPDEIGDADLYGFRVDGPWAPLRGDRFDASKLLLDPYARHVWCPAEVDRDAARRRGVDTIGRSPWGVLRAEGPPANRVARRVLDDLDDLVVAEVHVGAFTGSPTSGVHPRSRGTFAGMTERLDHFAHLGVTAVELLPVHAADPSEGSAWGYMPLAYMAIEPRYATTDDPAGELAALADACHERNMELWVDVVYNHTTEEGHLGPTYSMRGLDNRAYYVTTDTGEYIDDAGCGNVLAASHPAVADLVIASLERLVDLGVDGFRFDLASILGRDDHRLIERITQLGLERNVRLVAEPWDVVRYQVGPAFPGGTWMQWNDRFRDVVRSFVKGDPGHVAHLQEAVQGSPHLFPDSPRRSVNFVTAHDGFTLHDLVSYQTKRNEPNGHLNTDGANDNRSWNCGWEGDDDVPLEVSALRSRQIRNFLTVMLCSAGTPMLLAGDEMRRTQRGNNNAYRSNDESVWLDWTGLEESADLVRFVRGLIAFRRSHPSLSRATHWGDDVTFLHADTGHDLGWCLRGTDHGDADIAVLVNAHWNACSMGLPHGHWHRVVDTALAPPLDLVDEPVPIDRDHYELAPRSAVVLVAL